MASNTNSARSSFKGCTDPRHDNKVTQYRGIPYATIKSRFACPILNSKWQKATDYTKFGPRCSQVPVDVRELMKIPKDLERWPADTEDELKCTNLTISCPSDASFDKLPVIFWIHGGAQTHSFVNSSQRLGDTNPIVAQSLEIGKPIVVVAINYRLNILAFGDHEGELNLDLQDQRVALEWVKKYISIFGGDPDNITLAGESAGAIYTHALLASGTSVARAIMHSGCLYTTPPQPDSRGLGILGLIEGNLQIIEVEHGNMNPGESPKATIRGAPVDRLISTMKDLQITSKWTWEENSYKDWQKLDKYFSQLKGVMIGDCEAEGVIYKRTVTPLKASEIMKVFETTANGAGKKIAEAYGINTSDDDRSRKATIQFIGDARFNWPARDMTERLTEAGVEVYRFMFDQVNPFAQQKAIAHHAVDLFAIFGGYDSVVGDEMRTVGRTLRKNWILFANGEQPWTPGKAFAYGPGGKTGEITDEEAALRRRGKQFAVLKEVGFDVYQEIWWALRSAGATASSS